MATAGGLGERARELIDLHGQHAHQSLLAPAVQRSALDRFGEVDLGPLLEARSRRAELTAALGALGGDAGARAREADLLRYQLSELEAAAVTDPNEDEALDALEDELGDAVAHREAAALALAALADEGGAADAVSAALAALDGRVPFASAAERLRSLAAELTDLVAEVRQVGEAIEEDPERLAAVRDRRQLLVELRRKYGAAPLPDGGPAGGGTLADVVAFEAAAARRLVEIDGHDDRARELEAALAEAERAERAAATVVGARRRSVAPALADAVGSHLADLAMASARVVVDVDEEDPGDRVTFLLAANRGSDPAPLAKVASGGELARAMLALRLVLSAAPPILVFDEVDAGIGGQAALAVGRSLAALGADHQVLVVTHLPQVAAFADAQVSVRKDERDGRTSTSVATLEEPDRVVELSRMLSGTPDSERVQDAASELLALAAGERGR
jgi:DNA repair protein RecN (Recombination protein N)